MQGGELTSYRWRLEEKIKAKEAEEATAKLP